MCSCCFRLKHATVLKNRTLLCSELFFSYLLYWYKTINQHVNGYPCRDPKFIQFMPRSFHSPFPENHEPFRAKVYSQFDDIHVTEVRNFKNGPLVISVRCTGPYSLQVTGRSTLDFTYQLSSVENLETGESKRLLGSPVKGNGIIFQPHNILSVTYCVKVMT